VSSNDASTCRHALVSSACVRAAPWPTPLERNAAARDRGAEDRCGPREGEKRRRRGGGCGGGPAGTRQTCRGSSTAAILKAVVPHCPHLQEYMRPSRSAGCERRAGRAGGLHLTRVEPSRPRPSAPAAQPLRISVYARSAILPAIVHSPLPLRSPARQRARAVGLRQGVPPKLSSPSAPETPPRSSSRHRPASCRGSTSPSCGPAAGPPRSAQQSSSSAAHCAPTPRTAHPWAPGRRRPRFSAPAGAGLWRADGRSVAGGRAGERRPRAQALSGSALELDDHELEKILTLSHPRIFAAACSLGLISAQNLSFPSAIAGPGGASAPWFRVARLCTSSQQSSARFPESRFATWPRTRHE